MKKRFFTLLLLLMTFALAACAKPSANLQSSGQVELTVTFDDKTSETNQVAVKDGDTAMSVLKAQYDVEEASGFITTIKDVKQDESKKIYWMFDVNDEMAPKGADQLEVEDGDKLHFYQQRFE